MCQVGYGVCSRKHIIYLYLTSWLNTKTAGCWGRTYIINVHSQKTPHPWGRDTGHLCEDFEEKNDRVITVPHCSWFIAMVPCRGQAFVCRQTKGDGEPTGILRPTQSQVELLCGRSDVHCELVMKRRTTWRQNEREVANKGQAHLLNIWW